MKTFRKMCTFRDNFINQPPTPAFLELLLTSCNFMSVQNLIDLMSISKPCFKKKQSYLQFSMTSFPRELRVNSIKIFLVSISYFSHTKKNTFNNTTISFHLCNHISYFEIYVIYLFHPIFIRLSRKLYKHKNSINSIFIHIYHPFQ